MVAVLGDPSLYEFMGGAPPTLVELQDRYRRQVAGSPDPAQTWFNWVVRLSSDHRPVGSLQAEVFGYEDGLAARIAWVIGVPWQRRGYASEAAVAARFSLIDHVARRPRRSSCHRSAPTRRAGILSSSPRMTACPPKRPAAPALEAGLEIKTVERDLPREDRPVTSFCVFCRMIDRQVPASLAYEDADTVAILDVRQPRVGHVLVIPRQHVETVFELDRATASALMNATVVVARAVRDAFAPGGLNLWQSNGAAGGQEVPHVHMHVMPRWDGDGLLHIYPERVGSTDRGELDRQAARIREAIAP
jgi:histidine triad (HIT) family protein